MAVKSRSHILVPDTQVKPGHSLDHLEWVGRYVGERKPDVLVQIGDWFDMPSLSSYDKGKKASEGRRYQLDINAGNEGMARFEYGMKATGGARYKPRKVMTLGNHEQRILRHVEANAELEGKVGYFDFHLPGWEVHEFLEVVNIDGIAYSHFFPRSGNGRISQSRAGAPSASAQLARQGGSCSAGHQQGLDVACRPFRGRMQWGLIAGSCYRHEENYLTPQGTAYWRGVVVKHQVDKGNFCPMFVSLDYLQKRYQK